MFNDKVLYGIGLEDNHTDHFYPRIIDNSQPFTQVGFIINNWQRFTQVGCIIDNWEPYTQVDCIVDN